MSELESICMTYRHDYGLLTEDEQRFVQCDLLGVYGNHVKPAIERAETAEASLAAMRQRAEEAESRALEYAKKADAAIARAERAEEVLRDLILVRDEEAQHGNTPVSRDLWKRAWRNADAALSSAPTPEKVRIA